MRGSKNQNVIWVKPSPLRFWPEPSGTRTGDWCAPKPSPQRSLSETLGRPTKIRYELLVPVFVKIDPMISFRQQADRDRRDYEITLAIQANS